MDPHCGGYFTGVKDLFGLSRLNLRGVKFLSEISGIMMKKLPLILTFCFLRDASLLDNCCKKANMLIIITL